MALTKNITDALNLVYAKLTGFIGVEIVGLICNKMIFIQHNIITETSKPAPTMDYIKAWWTSESSRAGFLKDKIIISTIGDPCEAPESEGNESDNWVYMILFVCVTALLLLAMVRNFVIIKENS